MTDKTQPEALRLAEQYVYGDPAVHWNAWKAAVCAELRRQHARIAELEAQLEAVGAGGVQALSAAPAVPNGDELRRIARSARTSASDDASPTEYVLAGWEAAMLAASPTPPAEQQAAPKAAPQQKAHHLTQALTDPENQPNQYGVEFGMSGQQMHFKIGNQLFRLAYEPDDQQEFEFMKRMLISAFSTFTPDVKTAPQQEAQEPVGEVQHLHELNDSWLNKLPIGTKLYTAHQPAPAPLSDPRITAIEQAIRDYHYALDCRKHGGVAEVQAFGAICNAMKMHWVQGQESERRAALAAQGDTP